MRTRVLHVVTAAGFLALLCSVGAIQVAIEAGRGECPQVFDLFRHKPTAAGLRAYEKALAESSQVGRWLRPWWQFAQFLWMKDGGELARVGRDGWLFYRPGVMAPARSAAAVADPLPAIVHFNDQLAARGIRLLVVPAPNKESIYPEKLSARAADRPDAVHSSTRNLLARLQAGGVEVVDLFEVFAANRSAAGAPSGASHLYLAQDSHWSPAGVTLAARAVAQRLIEWGGVVRGGMACDRRPVPVRRVGDLVRMLQSPPLERAVGPELIPCVQVVRRADGQPYRDDAAAEILVLGDSFLRIFGQDAPGAAGFIAHLAAELQQPVASLVNDGGAATLVRQELFRRPALLSGKRIVIWEFVERDLLLDTEGWPVVPLPPALDVVVPDVAPDL